MVLCQLLAPFLLSLLLTQAHIHASVAVSHPAPPTAPAQPPKPTSAAVYQEGRTLPYASVRRLTAFKFFKPPRIRPPKTVPTSSFTTPRNPTLPPPVTPLTTTSLPDTIEVPRVPTNPRPTVLSRPDRLGIPPPPIFPPGIRDPPPTKPPKKGGDPPDPPDIEVNVETPEPGTPVSGTTGDDDEMEDTYNCDPDDRADCTPCGDLTACESSDDEAEGPQDALSPTGSDPITDTDPATGDPGQGGDDAGTAPAEASSAARLGHAAAAAAAVVVLLLLV